MSMTNRLLTIVTAFKKKHPAGSTAELPASFPFSRRGHEKSGEKSNENPL